MIGDSENTDESKTNSDVAVVTDQKVSPPKMCQVIIHNDDYTSMDFVIHVLQKFFNKPSSVARQLMLTIHEKGQAVCGVYTFEVAETKVFKVNKYAKQHGFPLKCTAELL